MQTNDFDLLMLLYCVFSIVHALIRGPVITILDALVRSVFIPWLAHWYTICGMIRAHQGMFCVITDNAHQVDLVLIGTSESGIGTAVSGIGEKAVAPWSKLASSVFKMYRSKTAR